ncbi:MAG: bifunctional DNA-formamidopyrimidine glycosylase/DNA-(apurinic or apyrimidinic site) lyase [Dehalococcoidia bacterium]
MPELPEVETLRRDLRERVLGRTFVEVWVSPEAARLVQGQSPEEFRQALVGRRIEDIGRRGKYLDFNLSDGQHLVVHRRMSGNFLHRRNGAAPDPYLRALFRLDDGSELRYCDMRKFGSMWLVADPATVLAGLGPEPLEPDFTPAELERRVGHRAASIKAVLLDQRTIAGLGNLYSDEALFAARIHPQRPARSLSSEEIRRLHGGIVAALEQGLRNRGSSLGTTLRDHVNLDGMPGRNQDRVQVFQRTGEPCYTCGTPIERIRVGGRSTHFCPRCQPSGG